MNPRNDFYTVDFLKRILVYVDGLNSFKRVVIKHTIETVFKSYLWHLKYYVSEEILRINLERL